MTPDELDAAGMRLYGPQWRAKLAQTLGVSLRAVQRWANGRQEVPEQIAEDIGVLLGVRERVDAARTKDRAR